MCITSILDRTTQKAHLDLHKEAWTPQLESMHVIRHEVNSLRMHQRGAFVRNIYVRNIYGQGCGEVHPATTEGVRTWVS